MERQTKWLWVATAANVLSAVVLVLALYATMAALAVIAPEISPWPILIFLVLGFVLSIIALKLARGVASKTARRAGYALNGFPLALDSVVLILIGVLLIGSMREQYIIPDGYKGDVYILHSVAGCQAVNGRLRSLTYHIPEDGVLCTSSQMPEWSIPEYDYARNDGSLNKIRNVWNTTIHRTPENLSNNSDIGVYAPSGLGKFTDSRGCTVKYEKFYVGTKAHLLTQYKPYEIARYVLEHPAVCTRSN